MWTVVYHALEQFASAEKNDRFAFVRTAGFHTEREGGRGGALIPPSPEI